MVVKLKASNNDWDRPTQQSKSGAATL